MKVKIKVCIKNLIVYQDFTTDTVFEEYDENSHLTCIRFLEEKDNTAIVIDYNEELKNYTKVDYLEIDNEKLDLKSDHAVRAGREGYFVLGRGIEKEIGVN